MTTEEGSAVSVHRRDPAIDALKLLAVLLVALGHAITISARFDAPGPGLVQMGPGLWVPQALESDPLLSVLYTFHMPLFAFLSGYVLFRPDPRPLGTEIARRAQGLLVPYFAWFTLTYTLSVLAGRSEWNGLLSGLARICVLPIDHYALWYLHALFLSSVVLAMASRVRLGLMLTALGSVSLMTVPAVRDVTFLGAGNILFVYSYVAAGFVVAREQGRLKRIEAPLAAVGGLSALLLGSAAATGLASRALSAHPVPWGVAFYVATVGGCLALVHLYRHMPHWSIRLQAFAGRYTLGIYAMHSIVQIALVEVLGSRSIWTVFVISAITSLLAAIAIEKTPVLPTLLLGRSARIDRRTQPSL